MERSKRIARVKFPRKRNNILEDDVLLLLSIIDCARGDKRPRTVSYLRVAVCRYGKLAPTLEPTSGEVGIIRGRVHTAKYQSGQK